MEKNRSVDMAVSKLNTLLNESMLTQKFKELYDSTITDVGLKMQSMHKAVEEDRKSFLRDYTLMTADYNAMQRRIRGLSDQVLLLQKEIESLQLQLNRTTTELMAVKKRYGKKMVVMKYDQLPRDWSKSL